MTENSKLVSAEEAVKALEELRQTHFSCDDCYYSCPKSPDGCCDDRQGDECNCGADAHNAKLDALIRSLPAVPQEEGPLISRAVAQQHLRDVDNPYLSLQGAGDWAANELENVAAVPQLEPRLTKEALDEIVEAAIDKRVADPEFPLESRNSWAVGAYFAVDAILESLAAAPLPQPETEN